ncbi:MAG TPA: DinB family protein [Thermoanaerobaculia bacterium]|nr:DinB family protein [Thermoanaerobaculia bacterium]
MSTVTADPLRHAILELLEGRGAHAGFDAVVADFPPELRGVRPAGLEHSGWELLEHLRIALWDLVEFSRDPEHRSPPWPAGYWPPAAGPPDDAAWEASVEAYRRHLGEMRALVADPERDLTAPLPWGDGQTLLREALLAADHASYHLGQMVDLRRLLGDWPPGSTESRQAGDGQTGGGA